MRVLSVHGAPPFPPDHALRLRSWRLLQGLAAADEVTVLTWRYPETTDADYEALGAVSELVVLPFHPQPNGVARRAARQVRAIAGDHPPYVQVQLAERGFRGKRGDGRRAFDDAVRSRHRRRPFDIVVLGEDALATIESPLDGVPVALHRLNVFEALIGSLRREHWYDRVRWPLERPSWARFDRRTLAHIDLTITPTPESAAALRRLRPDARVEVVENGVELPTPALDPRAGADVAFIGAMDYRANIDAVRWFASGPWATLASRFPDSRFRIVGRNPTADVVGLGSPRVMVTGEVPDVSVACAGARVGVVPLRAGMGIKTKTLELLAMGLPVVTTAVGAEGIDAQPSDGLIVADEAGIAEEVAALLDDPARAADLGAAARRYVARAHVWDASAEHYRGLLLATAARGVRR